MREWWSTSSAGGPVLLDLWLSEQNWQEVGMSEEDYAVKAAREWLGPPMAWKDCGQECEICRKAREAYAVQVDKLAAVIRKHTELMLEDLRLEHKAELEFSE